MKPRPNSPPVTVKIRPAKPSSVQIAAWRKLCPHLVSEVSNKKALPGSDWQGRRRPR